MTDLIIRPAAPGDRAGWEPLFLGYGDFYKVPMTAETLETVWGWIHDPGHVVEALVAERGGALVGLAHYRAMPSPLRGIEIGFLDDLFVDPAARGAKVGEALLARLNEISAERGWNKHPLDHRRRQLPRPHPLRPGRRQDRLEPVRDDAVGRVPRALCAVALPGASR